MFNRFIGIVRPVSIAGALLFAVGCSEYAVPSSGIRLGAAGPASALAKQTDPSIGAALDRKPTVVFPATVAVVRVQASGYETRGADVIQGRNFSVVLKGDVESEEQFKKLQKLPMLTGLVPLNRLELPSDVGSEEQLREAAATLHADMLMIYTFDDSLERHDLASAASFLTLGISPNIVFNMTATASAILVDTRNGYVYGSAEASQKRTGLANAWGEEETGDNLRRSAETAAFEKLTDNLEKTWNGILREYATPVPTTKGFN